MPDPFYPRGEREWKPSDEPTPMLLRAADALYEQCRRAIMAHRLDARSPIGDAVLDYRQERDEAAARSTDEPEATVTKLPSQWGADPKEGIYELGSHPVVVAERSYRAVGRTRGDDAQAVDVADQEAEAMTEPEGQSERVYHAPLYVFVCRNCGGRAEEYGVSVRCPNQTSGPAWTRTCEFCPVPVRLVDLLNEDEVKALEWCLDRGHRALDDGFAFPRDRNREIVEAVERKLGEKSELMTGPVISRQRSER